MDVFWEVVPCRLVVYRRFRVFFTYIIIATLVVLMMEVARISETSVNFYQNVRRNIPEDRHLQELI
jgi:hypothetical protein